MKCIGRRWWDGSDGGVAFIICSPYLRPRRELDWHGSPFHFVSLSFFGHCINKNATRANAWFLKFRASLVAIIFVQLNLTFIAWKKRTSCFIAQWRGPNCNQLYKVSLQSNVPCCLTKRLELLVCRWSFVNVQSYKSHKDKRRFGDFEIQVQVEKICGEMLLRLKTARCNKCARLNLQTQ